MEKYSRQRMLKYFIATEVNITLQYLHRLIVSFSERNDPY